MHFKLGFRNRGANSAFVHGVDHALYNGSRPFKFTKILQGNLMNGSEILLDNAERYSMLIATSLRNTSELDGNQERRMTQSRPNIGKRNDYVYIILTFL